VKALLAAGAPFDGVRQILEKHHDRGAGVFRSADGYVDEDGLIAAVAEESDPTGKKFDPIRYFCDSKSLFHVDGRTYALTNQWGGPGTAETLDDLLQAFPGRGVSYSVAKPDA
jgi:hypothetical protein